MIVGLLAELKIIGTFDRGRANRERIVVRALDEVNLGQYGLMLGIRGADGTAFPIRDNLLWFGDGILNPGDWLFIYTDPGSPTSSIVPNTNERLIAVHWGRPETVLQDPNIVPILFRVDAVHIETYHQPAPRLTDEV